MNAPSTLGIRPWPLFLILQGFTRPISDLSRGASVDDIVATTTLVLAMSETPK